MWFLISIPAMVAAKLVSSAYDGFLDGFYRTRIGASESDRVIQYQFVSYFVSGFVFVLLASLVPPRNKSYGPIFYTVLAFVISFFVLEGMGGYPILGVGTGAALAAAVAAKKLSRKT